MLRFEKKTENNIKYDFKETDRSTTANFQIAPVTSFPSPAHCPFLASLARKKNEEIKKVCIHDCKSVYVCVCVCVCVKKGGGGGGGIDH